MSSRPTSRTRRRAEDPAAGQDDARPQERGSTPQAPTSGWARLARMGRPRLTKGNALAAVLALALGFALQTQVNSTRDSGLENLRQEDLVGLLDKVNQRAGKLDREVGDLTRTRDDLKAPGADAKALQQAEARRTTLGILAGTVAATGPGITLTIADPQHLVAGSTLVDAVEELRDAGAEAMQLGDVRLVANSWIDVTDQGQVRVDGTAVNPPYVITAIGDPHTMSTAMAIPGGVVENLRQQGVTGTVAQSRSLKVTALRPAESGGYARPQPGS